MPPPRLAALGAVLPSPSLQVSCRTALPAPPGSDRWSSRLHGAQALSADRARRTSPRRPAGPNAVALSWSPSSPRGSAVVRYRVWRDGSYAGRTRETTYTVLGLPCASTSRSRSRPRTREARLSPRASVAGTTGPCPTTPPPPPPRLRLLLPRRRLPPRLRLRHRRRRHRLRRHSPPAPRSGGPRPARPGSGRSPAGWTRRSRRRCTTSTSSTPARSGERRHRRPAAPRGVGRRLLPRHRRVGELPARQGRVPGRRDRRLDGWSGERWLDIRKAAWPKFAPIVWRRLDLAKSLGCDAVEPDQNNPVGNNPGFPITLADQKAWYLEVARQAHLRGLSVGMKNGIETVDADTVAAFDWALNEECFQYHECDLMKPFVDAGKAVFQVEYKLTTTSFCTPRPTGSGSAPCESGSTSTPGARPAGSALASRLPRRRGTLYDDPRATPQRRWACPRRCGAPSPSGASATSGTPTGS